MYTMDTFIILYSSLLAQSTRIPFLYSTVVQGRATLATGILKHGNLFHATGRVTTVRTYVHTLWINFHCHLARLQESKKPFLNPTAYPVKYNLMLDRARVPDSSWLSCFNFFSVTNGRTDGRGCKSVTVRT